MGENKKTIQVNREYLSFSRSTRKKQKKEKNSRKRKEKPKTLQSAGKMRKEFMKKIKDFQKRRAENKNAVVEKNEDGKTKEEKEFDDEFNKSLGFLQDVMASNKEKERRKTERKKKEDNESLQIMLDMPSELTKKPIGEMPVKVDSQIKPNSSRSDNSTVFSAKSKKHRATVKVGISPQPPYSCLKGSDRPTYREWMRTQKNHSSGGKKPHISIENKPEVAETERSRKLKKLKRERTKDKPKRMIKSKRVTKTIKRKLGKIGKSVSVLIKSRETRKKIATERATLNKTSLHDIKKYLRERNMIKTGTKAPNHVLRKIYEQCILSGDVCNKSADVLVHNYLNE
jgi:hypothetical protein